MPLFKSVDVAPSAPLLSQLVAVQDSTSDISPSYTFSSTEAGTITFNGSCDSPLDRANEGDNIVTFNRLEPGTYSDCTIVVRGDGSDQDSNTLSVNTFTINALPPLLAQVTPVQDSTSDISPSYTFSSTEAGTITFGGSCESSVNTVIEGENTVTFNLLEPGLYSDCTIVVRGDASDLDSNTLSVNTFIIRTLPPVLTQLVAVQDSTADISPSYSFDTVSYTHLTLPTNREV